MKKIVYWRYLGFTKDVLAPYKNDIAEDNLRVLRDTLLYVSIVFLLELAAGYLTNYLLPESMFSDRNLQLLLGGELMNLLLLGACWCTSRLPDKLRVARWLTTLTLTAWYLLCLLISTVMNQNLAILMCAMLLLEQVLFDTLPEDNLLFAAVTYGCFIAMSFIHKSVYTAVLDTIYALPFFLIGNYLSWKKSRAKWETLINQNAIALARLREVEKKVAESQLSVMLTQLQPHFLFNTLSTIAFLCDEDPPLAQKATFDFSEYLRGNIKALKTDLPIPFTEELEHLKAYLALETLRFEGKLKIVYDIGVTDFQIPAVTVLLLAENAVNHGICAQEESGTITISTREGEDCWEISVADDGAGFDPEKLPEDSGGGRSISGMRVRLAALGGTLEVRSRVNVGTEAVIRIPKEEIHAHIGG